MGNVASNRHVAQSLVWPQEHPAAVTQRCPMIHDTAPLPLHPTLHQSHPNPSRAVTTDSHLSKQHSIFSSTESTHKGAACMLLLGGQKRVSIHTNTVTAAATAATVLVVCNSCACWLCCKQTGNPRCHHTRPLPWCQLHTHTRRQCVLLRARQ